MKIVVFIAVLLMSGCAYDPPSAVVDWRQNCQNNWAEQRDLLALFDRQLRDGDITIEGYQLLVFNMVAVNHIRELQLQLLNKQNKLK